MDLNRRDVYRALNTRVGNTSLHRLCGIEVPNGNRIWAKLEYENPTESAFDRVYPGLFELAESEGKIFPGITPVIECSTGNAGASFAWAAKELGYKSHVVIHADSPAARIAQIRALGADIILSPPGLYGAGYVELLNNILADDRASHATNGKDPATRLYAVTKIVPAARRFHAGIAQEALAQLLQATGRSSFSAFVAAVGSGDLICGVAEELERLGPRPLVVGMEAAEMPTVSALMRGDVLTSAPLPVEDLMLGVTGTSLPPDRLNIDFSLIDDVRGVTVDGWKTAERMLGDEEGLFVGRTSAGSLSAALSLCHDLEDADILTVFFDPKWKYTANFSPRHAGIYRGRILGSETDGSQLDGRHAKV
jgi:cysteine synthase A